VTADELEGLARLLRKLAVEGLGTPRLPKEVFSAFQGVVTQPTVEVLVTRSGSDVLLTQREDKNWHGYHLPGGFVGVGESVEAACDRVARRELGASATLQRIVGSYAWSDHPYASPLSLLCLCTLDGPPRDGAFFEQLPDGLLRQHRELIESCWPPRGRD
jgi:ADP-ribose pyrophosphatase YjhB (NUDIX family)